MKRIIGFGIGIVYFGLAFGALRTANAGWDTGYTDLGFWWTVIAALLGIAAIGAIGGTYLHTREQPAHAEH